MKEIAIVVAISENRVIGRDGKLPWKLPRDMARFVDLTIGNTVIIGRKTFESIPESFRPFKNRRNFILSRDLGFASEGCSVFRDLETAVEAASSEKIFIVGGASVYKEALKIADRIFLTLIHAKIEGDTFFPEVDAEDWSVSEAEFIPKDERNEYDISFLVFKRKK